MSGRFGAYILGKAGPRRAPIAGQPARQQRWVTKVGSVSIPARHGSVLADKRGQWVSTRGLLTQIDSRPTRLWHQRLLLPAPVRIAPQPCGPVRAGRRRYPAGTGLHATATVGPAACFPAQWGLIAGVWALPWSGSRRLSRSVSPGIVAGKSFPCARPGRQRLHPDRLRDRVHGHGRRRCGGFPRFCRDERQSRGAHANFRKAA